MPKYDVIVPFAGYFTCYGIEAESEGAAQEIAFDECGSFTITSDSAKHAELSEWDTHESFGSGNVTYLSHTEVEVELSEDQEPDDA